MLELCCAEIGKARGNRAQQNLASLVEGLGRDFSVEALNERGQVLLSPVAASLANLSATQLEHRGRDRITGEIAQTEERFPEENRSRQPSVFSVLRALVELFGSAAD